MTPLTSTALLILRLGLSAIFLTHGYYKLFHPKLGPRRFAEYLRQVNVPQPIFVAYFIGVLELAAGCCIATGLFTRWAAGALALHVTLALIATGPQRGFTRLPDAVGCEFEVILLAALLCLALQGPGSFSLTP